MMLFLDDLPLQLGAYYPVGTNNIVLNRALVDIVEQSISSKPTVNALTYNLLLHEYLHALGELSEAGVRRKSSRLQQNASGTNTLQQWCLAKVHGFCLKISHLDPFIRVNVLWKLLRILRKRENTLCRPPTLAFTPLKEKMRV